MFVVESANAAILWAGGEDIDFQFGSAPCVNTTAGTFRSAYARSALTACAANSIVASTPFLGGAVTSAWVSGRVYYTTPSYALKFFGLGRSGTSGSLFVGLDSITNPTKVALYKFDGTTWTKLQAETGSSLVTSGITKIDMQVINYGASATVNVYVNGATAAVITYTGDVTAGGTTNLDQVVFTNFGIAGYYYGSYSELIVADTDTRSLSLATLAPNAAGDTNQWASGTFSNINPNTINDASLISDGTASNNFQANLTDLPTGSFSVQAVKISARAVKSSTGPASLKVGVKTNATISVPAATALQLTFGQVETLYQTNPVTALPWTSSDGNNLQINLQVAP